MIWLVGSLVLLSIFITLGTLIALIPIGAERHRRATNQPNRSE